jgi:hypothetical protein
MPNYDGSGPQGRGQMTGGGFGFCRRARWFGMGFGHRRGQGKGRGLGKYFGWNISQTKEDEIDDIKDYKKALEEELEDVNKELSVIQKQQ